MKGCLKGLIWFIIIGLICTVIVTWIASGVKSPPSVPSAPSGTTR